LEAQWVMTDRLAARIDWVVFDLGETLVDESPNWARWAYYLEVSTPTFFAALGAAIAMRRNHHYAFNIIRPGFRFAEEAARMGAAGLAWQFGPSDLYDDALPALAALREAGFRLAVMANQPAIVSPFMATLPVDRWATSEGLAVSKPDRAFFERVIAELGVPAESIAYVGDRVDNDVIPAKAAGMTAIHLRRGPWGVIQAEWPEAAQADARIESLLELPGVLNGYGPSR
jgi:FMN phosphatase YigB (HAD superfamily)